MNKGVILAVLLIVGLGVGAYYSGVFQMTGLGTINSITTAPIIFSEGDLANVNFIVDVTLDGGADTLVLGVSEGEAEAYSGGAWSLEDALQFNVEAVDEDVYYPISNLGIGFKQYTIIHHEGGIWSNPAPCSGLPMAEVVGESTAFNFDVDRWCFYGNPVGTFGALDTSSVVEAITLRVSGAGGVSDLVTFGSGSQNQGTVPLVVGGDNIGTAHWTGNLVTGASVPTPANFKSLWLESDGWRIIRTSDFSGYQSLSNAYELNVANEDGVHCNSQSGGDCSQIINGLISQLNIVQNEGEDLVDMDVVIGDDAVNRYNNRNSVSNGVVIAELDWEVANPNVVFRLRGDWVGIIINSGDPDVLDVDCENINSGESGVVEARVKNVGSSDANFEFDVMCDNVFQQSNNFIRSFDGGQTRNIDVPVIAGGVSSDVLDSCELRVSDVASGDYDTMPFTCFVENPSLCADGDTQIVGDCLTECVDGVWEIVNCDQDGDGDIDDDDIFDPLCKPTFAIGGVTIIPNFSGACSDNIFTGLLTSAGFGLLGGVFAFMLFKFGLKKAKFSRNKRGIIGLVLFVGFAGIILWFFYWWAYLLLLLFTVLVWFIARGRL